MALIPHPCYHQDQFRFDTDTSQIGLNFNPNGRLTSDVNGLRVTAAPPHMAWSEVDLMLSGAILAGILAPSTAGPVTSVMSGAMVTNSFPVDAMLEISASFNGVILGPVADAASAVLQAQVSVDGGVTWNLVTTIGMMTPVSDSRSAHYTQQDAVRYNLLPGQTVNLQWILTYFASIDNADYIQAAYLRTRQRLHSSA